MKIKSQAKILPLFFISLFLIGGLFTYFVFAVGGEEIDLFEMTSEKVFTKLISNEVGLTQGEAVFEINNPLTNLDLEEALKFDFIEAKNRINKYEFYINYSEPYQVPIYKIVSVEQICNRTNELGINESYDCPENLSVVDYYETKYKEEWKVAEGKIDKGTYKIKIIGFYNASLGGVEIDWIPNLLFKKELGLEKDIALRKEEWAWWNSSWNYKKEIKIQENSVIAQINYSVLLNVTYDSDMNTSFKDLRFTNGSENTELKYYIENKVDSSYADVWVLVPNLASGVNTTIYMYYGNDGVSSSSDRNTAFLYFNDFSADPFSNGWNCWDATCTYQAGTEDVDLIAGSGFQSAVMSYDISSYSNIEVKYVESGISTTYWFATEIRTASGSGGALVSRFLGHSTDEIQIDSGTKTSVSDLTVASNFTSSFYNFSSTITTQNLTSNGGTILQNTSVGHDNTYVNLHGRTSSTVTIDNLRIRRYTLPEPGYYFGAEESSVLTYELNITDPLSSGPKSVSSGDNITLTFNFTEDNVTLTSGVTMENVTIGDSYTAIVTDSVCEGTLDCTQYSTQASCINCSQCSWGSGIVQHAIFFDGMESGWGSCTSGGNPPNLDCANIGEFTGCDASGDYQAGCVTDQKVTGSNGLGMEDWDTWSTNYATTGIWYTFNPTTACDGGPCDYINFTFQWTDLNDLDNTGEYMQVLGNDSDQANVELAKCDSTNCPTSFAEKSINLSAYLDDTDSTWTIRIGMQTESVTDEVYWDDFNITGYKEGVCSNDGACSSCVLNECDTNCSTAGCSIGSSEQFAYVSGEGWQANVTVPTFASGLKDLFVNATYDGNTRNDTETNAINYGAVGDTCTYTSGNWEVNCADYCNITSNVEAGGNNIILSGTGFFNILANITADSIAWVPTCQILNVPGDGNELKISGG